MNGLTYDSYQLYVLCANKSDLAPNVKIEKEVMPITMECGLVVYTVL